MKDSQPVITFSAVAPKYIKESNERFSTSFDPYGLEL